ncbi:anthranilate synthase component I [Georgenia sp. Z1491]|uniref:anthranilate synthase component I n=1 Tax=Georgenia sp. Z1491 TaxID=3416707 RepID=UPI003CEFA581
MTRPDGAAAAPGQEPPEDPTGAGAEQPVEPAWGETWPSLPRFRELARDRRVIPVVRRLLADDVTPVGVYRRLAAGRPGTFLMESAEAGRWSRWSFVGVGSRATLTSRGGRAAWRGDVPVGIPTDGPVLEVLAAALDVLGTPAIPGLPPLTGGFVGSLGWDVVHEWEPTLPRVAPSDDDLPEVALCLASDVVALDHLDGTLWLVADAVNTDGSHERVDEAHADAVARLDAMQEGLLAPAPALASVLDPAGELPEVTARFADEDFQEAVRVGKQRIVDGDIFQVVLSQRLDVTTDADPLDVYRVLRTVNPSPYMYLFALDDGIGGMLHVVGSSPETLVKVSGEEVITFPIAGSRPRGTKPAEDRELAEELLADPKELSEHVMLVDLARNDLSKVCRPETVEVTELMEIKRFSHIMHISSTVTGRRRPDATALDCLRATFPAGTLSGAPKVRAIEIIDSLEPSRRGVYGGVVGYLDLAGDADLAIAIRTAVLHGGRASVQAGAGVVADSVPATELQEATNKAAAALRAVRLASRLRPAAAGSPARDDHGAAPEGTP